VRREAWRFGSCLRGLGLGRPVGIAAVGLVVRIAACLRGQHQEVAGPVEYAHWTYSLGLADRVAPW
jgi:hypothetical protein